MPHFIVDEAQLATPLAFAAAAATAERLHLVGDPLQKPRAAAASWPQWGGTVWQDSSAGAEPGLSALDVPSNRCALAESFRVRPAMADFLRELLPDHCVNFRSARPEGRSDGLRFFAYTNDSWWHEQDYSCYFKTPPSLNPLASIAWETPVDRMHFSLSLAPKGKTPASPRTATCALEALFSSCRTPKDPAPTIWAFSSSCMIT